MQSNSKKMACIVLAFSILASVLTECKKSKTVWGSFDEKNEINIAILGSEEYLNSDKGFIKGIDMAVDELKENNRLTVNIKIFDDGGNYNIGVSNAQSVVNDSSIAFALTLQDFEIIDTVASIFNEAKKPLVVLQGCYDKTSERGYDYLLTDFVSGFQMGTLMGKYAVLNGIKNIVSCHTDTEFEKDEIKGMQFVIKSYDTQIVDCMTGPYTQKEFDNNYNTWSLLDVDAVYLNFYSFTLGSEVIKMLHDKNPNILVMTDYSINNEDTLNRYKNYLNGTVIVPLYPCEKSDKLIEFHNKFYNKYQFNVTDAAVQVYDIIMMLCKYASSGAQESKDLMKMIKSDNGYEGVSRNIKFDQKGRLIVDGVEYLICREGKFVSIDDK